MRKMICVGTMPLSGYLKCKSGSIPTAEERQCYLDMVETKEHTATSVFEHVCLDWHSINHVFHVFTLVDSQSSEAVKYAWMNASSTICNNADHDFLPTIWPPHLARFPRGKVGNVFHYAVQCAAEENFVLLL